jgi:hypothetical protein
MADNNNYFNPLSITLFVFQVINISLLIISEYLGLMHKFTPNCTSISEAILKYFKFIQEPSLDERLEYLQGQRNRNLY